VDISVVEGGNAVPVAISPDQFDFSDTGLKEPPKQVALAGFRVTYPINKPDKFDEIIAFWARVTSARSAGGSSMAHRRAASPSNTASASPNSSRPFARSGW